MKRTTISITGALVLAAGCSVSVGDDDDDDGGSAEQSRLYEATDLVSDQQDAAPNVDPNLVNPWGLAFGPDTFFWVANNGTSTSTLYDGDGVVHNDEIGGAVQLPRPNEPLGAAAEGEEEEEPPGPTGIVFYGGDGFEVADGAPSRFLFATTAGNILGWSPDADPHNAVTMIDGSATGKAYTGLAIAEDGDRTLIYAADFAGAHVDVFDEAFEPVHLSARAFVDSDLPDGYAPFGIQTIGGRIFVMYAEQDPATGEERTGAGRGFVSVFATDGTFRARVASKGELNAPWGLAQAPDEFGRFSGALLVGNFGDGRITAFDMDTYRVLGQLESEMGNPIEIDGLWALAFGNDEKAGESHDLYFTAGPDEEMHGVFGEIGVLGGEEEEDEE